MKTAITPPPVAKLKPFDATLGLGSNIGDKRGNIEEAVRRLDADDEIAVVARSKLYRSAPWGGVAQDWFINACVAIATDLNPGELLSRCQAIEEGMGRVKLQHWGPRVIDVDILTYRDQTLSAPDLVIPHPMITKRSFVLVPLRDVAPNLKLNGRSIEAWIADLGTGDLAAIES